MSSARAPLFMVAALARRSVIGRDGGLAFRYSEDQKRFRRLTKGHAVIMGRSTYDSIGKPLPERRNIVVTRDPSLRIPGCETATSLERALELARERDPEPCVIGGGELYALALPLATRLELTYVDLDVPGDVYFPEFDPSEWTEVARTAGEDPALSYVTLVRR